ncbi:MAG TPA: hypothetical protein VHM90_11450 [Phycisphaerae bacterium]|nr:hypothetical protein [Phycisphaerae bacterium]
MDSTSLDYARSGWRARSTLAARAASVVAAVVVLLLLIDPPFIDMSPRLRGKFGAMMQEAALAGTGLGSRTATVEGGIIVFETRAHVPMAASSDWLTLPLAPMPLILIVALLATAVAARQLEMKWLGQMILLSLAAAVVVLVFPLLAGFLAGWALSLEVQKEVTFWIVFLIKGVAPAAIGAAVAATWAIADWALPETSPPAHFIGRPWELWAGVGGCIIPALLYVLACVSLLWQVKNGVLDTLGVWEALRYASATVASGTAATLLLRALIRGQRSQWAWVWMCALAPLGGGAGAGAAILLAALCARAEGTHLLRSQNSLGNSAPGNV